MGRHHRVTALLLALLLLAAFSAPVLAEETADDTRTLRIIATSDLHGKFLP